MLFSAFCFASMVALSHAVAANFDWVAILFARVFVGFLAIAGLALLTSKPLIFFSAPKNLWARSISGTVASFGAFYAYATLPVAEATCVFNTTPLWMAILVFFVFRERISPLVWIAIACGIAGVMLVQRPQFDQANVAIMAGLAGAFFGAVAVYNLHLIKNLHPTTIVAHFSMTASIVTFAALVPSLFSSMVGSDCTRWVIIGLVGVGVLGTVGQLALTRAYMLGNPTINSTVGLAQVAFGVGFDILVWNRSFDTPTIIGILLITNPLIFFAARRSSAAKVPDVKAGPAGR
jgi:drug/metabolite transporter (DMT)-like permease